MAIKRGVNEALEKGEEDIARKIIKYLGLFLIAAGTFCLVVFAWFLIIIGIIGLVFPIIPGLLLIFIGASLLGGKKFTDYTVKSTTKTIGRVKRVFRAFRKKIS